MTFTPHHLKFAEIEAMDSWLSSGPKSLSIFSISPFHFKVHNLHKEVMRIFRTFGLSSRGGCNFNSWRWSGGEAAAWPQLPRTLWLDAAVRLANRLGTFKSLFASPWRPPMAHEAAHLADTEF
jgi:hypothetical protein